MQPINYPAQPITTRHQITLQKETINYTAHVGFMPIRSYQRRQRGAPVLHLLFQRWRHRQIEAAGLVSFQRGTGRRHHLAAHGSVRPQDGEDETGRQRDATRATYVDNPDRLLDTGDLVFIDAMGTGYSRPDKPTWGPNFGGVERDLAAFGEFIRSFLNEYNLWGSPLFVGGKSYGTTRAAGLAGYLTDRDCPINGVMLLSAISTPMPMPANSASLPRCRPRS